MRAGRFWALAGVMSLYFAFAWLIYPGRDVILCPFRILTGLRCPLCGLSHSIGALLHGSLRMSVEYHPLGPLVVAVCCAAVAARLANSGVNRGEPGSRGLN